MNYQWMAAGAPCPIVEFHDVKAEKFKSDRYLELTEETLAAPLAAAGVVALGQFRVTGQPDRLIGLRGFSSTLARRQALTSFHAGESWGRARAEAVSLVREAQVILSRTVTPAEGVRAVRAGEPMVAMISEVRFAEQIGNYHLWLRLLLRKAGMDPVAAFATLEAVNDVPAVPVVRHRSHHVALMPAGKVPELPPELRGMLRYRPEILDLEPALVRVW